MKPYRFLFFISFLWIIGACSVTNIYKNNVDPKTINEVIFFEPMNTICSIDFNNKVKYEDSLSNLSNEVLKNVVDNLSDSLKIKMNVQLSDSTDFHKLLSLISRNNYQNSYIYEIKSAEVPYSMDSTLRANNIRFGLVLITIGTVRSNYEEFKRKVARNEIRLKYDDAFPDRYISRVYSALVDTTKNDFVLLNKSEKKRNPLDPTVLNKQVKEALIGAFFAASCCP